MAEKMLSELKHDEKGRIAKIRGGGDFHRRLDGDAIEAQIQGG